jgi:hypothetical protein
MATSSDEAEFLTYSVPQIDHTAIAVLSADESQVVVMGVEKGTAIYEAEKNDGETPDGSLVSENRVAAVGINAYSNNYLTDDAFTLIEAGINWIQETTAIEDESGLYPGEYTLNQNYPNPFNPTTQISFALKENNHTTLKVYDALGREVATLVDGKMSQGTHIVNFDATNYTSGVYFYQLTSGSFTETRKMMFVK